MIVSSQIIINDLQIDGRRVIREEHIDDQGIPHIVDYMADEDTDIDAKLAQHASDLNDQSAGD